MSPERILVFDMDGVLVDVSESYRETIQQTVEHFTGKRVTRQHIQDWKNRGGWNDDWALSTALIHAEGVDAEYNDVVDYFQGIFHGPAHDGLILRERWIARDGLLERLSERYRLAVFTGRLRWEAELTLRRFAPGLPFDPRGCALVSGGVIVVRKDQVLHRRVSNRAVESFRRARAEAFLGVLPRRLLHNLAIWGAGGLPKRYGTGPLALGPFTSS